MSATAVSTANQTPVAVGDVWECIARTHNGWRIRITKVSQSNCAYALDKSIGKADHVGRWKTHHLLLDVLRRDFVRVHVAEQRTNERIRLVEATDVAREGVAADAMNFTGPVLPAAEGIPARSVGHKICEQCGVLKPLDDFDHFTGNAAKNNPTGRLKMCHSCVVAKRRAGINAAFAARGGKQKRTLAKEAAAAAEAERVAREQEMIDRELAAIEKREQAAAARAAQTASDGEPIVFNAKSVAEVEGANVVPTEAAAAPSVADADRLAAYYPLHGDDEPQRPRTSLGVALLELAAQADLVEHPPAYRELYAVLDAALRAGTEAGAVFVLPADNYLALQIAVESARRDFEAPAADATATEQTNESNWRKILRDMNVRANGVAP